MASENGRKYSKRKFVEIRNQIIDSLTKFPKSTSEVSKDIDCAFKTAERHLQYLKDIGIVVKANFAIGNKEQKLWVVRKG